MEASANEKVKCPHVTLIIKMLSIYKINPIITYFLEMYSSDQGLFIHSTYEKPAIWKQCH
jgi:hypothetical protein